MRKEEEVIKHESFGMIRFSRVNGSGQKFFGSELSQNNYISMELDTGTIKRDLTNEWFHPNKNIIRLRLTSNQFAELITSLNQGSGIPCTLEYIQGKKVEQLDNIESRKEFLHRKFKERMESFGNNLIPKSVKVKELLKKPKLSKDDKFDLQKIIDGVIQEVNSNIPFFIQCFQEDADKVVQEAKSEVENAIMYKITAAGMEKLFEDGLLNLKENNNDSTEE